MTFIDKNGQCLSKYCFVDVNSHSADGSDSLVCLTESNLKRATEVPSFELGDAPV